MQYKGYLLTGNAVEATQMVTVSYQKSREESGDGVAQFVKLWFM